MDHLIQPLEDLLSRAGTFVSGQGPRVLHVGADGDLYRAALRTVAVLEWSPRNRRQFIDVTPAGEGETDWGACRDRLAGRYAQIRAVHAEQGVSLPELKGSPATDALIGFGAAVLQAAQNLSSRPAPTEGIAMILGTGAFADQARAAEQIASLVTLPSLGTVRWVLVEPGELSLRALIRHLGPDALSVSCRIDRERQRREVDDLLDALAGAASAPAGPARAGGARPTVAPPPRLRAPLDAGASPANAHVPLLLQGVKAVRGGDLPRAVQFQREAIACCTGAGNVTGAVEMQTLLAVYLGQLALGGAQPLATALDAFEEAVTVAAGSGLAELGARASMLRGILANAGGDRPAAALSLHRAALLAETAGATELRAEASRLAADVVERAGLVERAAEIRERVTPGQPAGRGVAASGD